MFCIKCGAQMSDEAEFCAKCGFAAGDAEVTRVAAHHAKPQFLQTETAEEHLEEVHIFSIRPTALFIQIGYVLAVLAGIGLVAALTWLGMPAGLWWLLVLVGLAPLLIPAYYHLMRNMILYTLTDSKIEIDKGFISHHAQHPAGKDTGRDRDGKRNAAAAGLRQPGDRKRGRNDGQYRLEKHQFAAALCRSAVKAIAAI
jgi:hypothetical protein